MSWNAGLNGVEDLHSGIDPVIENGSDGAVGVLHNEDVRVYGLQARVQPPVRLLEEPAKHGARDQESVLAAEVVARQSSTPKATSFLPAASENASALSRSASTYGSPAAMSMSSFSLPTRWRIMAKIVISMSPMTKYSFPVLRNVMRGIVDTARRRGGAETGSPPPR